MKKLAIVFVLISAFSQAYAQSLGDAARKNRSRTTEADTKRVWTTDDFPDFPSTGKTGAAVSLAETPESTSATLQKFRDLGKEELGAAVLKMANAPNVEFPDRKNWEQKLFDAKRAWLDQVERMMAHEGANKATEDTELRLTVGAQQIFERISDDGVQQARAVNDPVLRAHMQYEKQCRTAPSSFSCLEMKWQMQSEGIW